MSRGLGSPPGSESHSSTNKGAIKCITATRPSTTTITGPLFFFLPRSLFSTLYIPLIKRSDSSALLRSYSEPNVSATKVPFRSQKSKVTTSSVTQLKNRIEIEAHLAMHWHVRPTNPSSLPFYDDITWLHRITAPRAFLVLWSVQGIAVPLTLDWLIHRCSGNIPLFIPCKRGPIFTIPTFFYALPYKRIPIFIPSSLSPPSTRRPSSLYYCVNVHPNIITSAFFPSSVFQFSPLHCRTITLRLQHQTGNPPCVSALVFISLSPSSVA